MFIQGIINERKSLFLFVAYFKESPIFFRVLRPNLNSVFMVS